MLPLFHSEFRVGSHGIGHFSRLNGRYFRKLVNFALVELRALIMPSVNGRFGSGDVICFALLNDCNQSAADHQDSTAAGQRKLPFDYHASPIDTKLFWGDRIVSK